MLRWVKWFYHKAQFSEFIERGGQNINKRLSNSTMANIGKIRTLKCTYLFIDLLIMSFEFSIVKMLSNHIKTFLRVTISKDCLWKLTSSKVTKEFIIVNVLISWYWNYFNLDCLTKILLMECFDNAIWNSQIHLLVFRIFKVMFNTLKSCAIVGT